MITIGYCHKQCDKLQAEAAVLPGLRAELEALRRRHSSALELMGERDEEVLMFNPCFKDSVTKLLFRHRSVNF